MKNEIPFAITYVEALQQVLDPIRDQDRAILRERATQLKQTDGEGWAIGEMLERACIVLDAVSASLLDEAINRKPGVGRQRQIRGTDQAGFIRAECGCEFTYDPDAVCLRDRDEPSCNMVVGVVPLDVKIGTSESFESVLEFTEQMFVNPHVEECKREHDG